MNKIDLAIFGAGGHTRSLLNLVDSVKYNIIGIFDNSFSPDVEEYINGIKVVNTLQNYNNISHIVLSYGNNMVRKELFDQYKYHILKENLIHKTANIENYVSLGESNQIFSKTIINSNIVLGNNNIINSGCILEHEVIIGSNNHISVGALVCGRSIIGDSCYIGAGAVVIDKIKINNNVTIGANSVVIKDISNPGTYVGNPARKIK